MIQEILNLAVLCAVMVFLMRAPFLLIPSPLVRGWLAAFSRMVTRHLLRLTRALIVPLARNIYFGSLAAVEWLAHRWNRYWEP